MENRWKKAASFAISLALVAANSAISLPNSNTIVAKAAEATTPVIETASLITADSGQKADESYFDAETQTLHLKGYVRNGGEGTGLILPEGIDGTDVKVLVADEGTVLPVDCSYLMYNLNNVKTVDMKNADSSAVTNMSFMFVPYHNSGDGEYCYPDGRISEIDLTGLDTSNVTDMHRMFEYLCVESLDLSSFDTSKVTDMSEMFACMYSIKDLDVSSFDTSNVTNMSGMFGGWWHVSNYVDITGFDTSNVTDMSYMFYFNSLDAFDITNFDTSSVTDMSEMFGWGGAEIIDLSSFDTSKVTDMSGMFYMTRPETIYVGPGWTAESAFGYEMFGECYDIVGGAGTVFDPDHVDTEYAHVDGGAEDPGYFTYKTPKKDESYFDAETSTLHLKGHVINKCDGSGIKLPKNVEKENIHNIVAEEGTVFPQDCSYFFAGFDSLWVVDLKNADTSNVTDMSYMFMRDEYGTPCQTNIDLSNFNTQNVNSMKGMFYFSTYDVLDLRSFDTSNVTDMSEMFEQCVWTRSIDVSSFDTSNVTDMSKMFSCCRDLETLDLSNFDTSKVKNMHAMFCFTFFDYLDLSCLDTSSVTDMSWMFGDSHIKEVNFTNFNTQNVTDMNAMFTANSDIEVIDLSSFDTSNVTDMSSMFSGCSSLKTVFVSSKWSAQSLEIYNGTNNNQNIFEGCYNLTGGKGTVYDDEHIDFEYARIDGGKDAPGYFTAVNSGAEEVTANDSAIPKEAMDTINYLYSNINDPTLKSIANAAINLFNKMFSYKIA